ncbi:MAG: hypothetical protein Q7S87_17325 [Agitococcus sp.]|nr:hypothetical protein [Agitococcus sp.]
MPYIKSVVARVQHGYRLHQTLSRYFGVSLSRIPCGLRDWFRKAATQGDSNALNNLGVMYENGEGITKNLVLAHMLYN